MPARVFDSIKYMLVTHIDYFDEAYFDHCSTMLLKEVDAFDISILHYAQHARYWYVTPALMLGARLRRTLITDRGVLEDDMEH